MALNSGFSNNKNVISMGGGNITRLYNDRILPGAAVTIDDTRSFANGSPIVYGTTTPNAAYLHSELSKTINRQRTFHNGPNDTTGSGSVNTNGNVGPGGN